MKKSNPLRWLLPAVACVMMLLAAEGCNTTGCLDNRSSLPIAGFYSYEKNAAINIDSITVMGIGAPGDSLLLTAGKQVQQLYLPFSSERSQVRYLITYVWQQAPLPDTLTFDYETTPYFVSEECGAMYRYRITRYAYSTHLLDSMAVVDSLITNVERVNIKLFYRTETPGEE